MQSINMVLNHLTGMGWKNTCINFTCNPQIGIDAGKDEFATARGTAIKIMRQYGLWESTDATITIDHTVVYNIHVYQSKFQKTRIK